jgi:hypothetical protein
MIPSLLDSYKQTTVINQLSSIPPYQATILLTQYHLMMGETGPLTLHLRHLLATQALSQSALSEKFKAFDNETKNLKNFGKFIALQRVNKIMADKPWAINKCHILFCFYLPRIRGIYFEKLWNKSVNQSVL